MVFKLDGCSFHYAHENFDIKIDNLEEGDFSIEVTNHSQRIFTLIQNNNLSIL